MERDIVMGVKLDSYGDKTPKRRNVAKVRNLIQKSLRKRPMTLGEIAQDNSMSSTVVKRNLEWLQALGLVESFLNTYEIEGENKTVVLWRPKKSPKK